MGYGSYWLHLFIFRGCSTLKCILTAMFTRILFSFPYTREGKEEAPEKPGSNIWMWCCSFRASFRNTREHCSICQSCGTSVVTYAARGQFACSPEPERISKDSKGGRTTFSDSVTMPPSLLEVDVGLGLFRTLPAMLFVSVHLHLRMSAHNY